MLVINGAKALKSLTDSKVDELSEPGLSRVWIELQFALVRNLAPSAAQTFKTSSKQYEQIRKATISTIERPSNRTASFAPAIAIMASTQSVQCFGKKKTGTLSWPQSIEILLTVHSNRGRPLQGTD